MTANNTGIFHDTTNSKEKYEVLAYSVDHSLSRNIKLIRSGNNYFLKMSETPEKKKGKAKGRTEFSLNGIKLCKKLYVQNLATVKINENYLFSLWDSLKALEEMRELEKKLIELKKIIPEETNEPLKNLQFNKSNVFGEAKYWLNKAIEIYLKNNIYMADKKEKDIARKELKEILSDNSCFFKTKGL